MGEISVSKRIGLLVLETAAAYGVEPQSLLDAAGLDAGIFSKTLGRVPLPLHLAFCNEAIRRTLCPSLGFFVGTRFQPGTMGTMGFQAQFAQSLADAVWVLSSRWPVFSEWTRLSVETENAEVRIEAVPLPGVPKLPRYIEEMFLSGFAALVRQFTHSHISPQSVHLTHSAPPYAFRRDFEAHFNAPLNFDQPKAYLVYDREVLHMEAGAFEDRKLFRMFGELAALELQALPASDSLTGRIARIALADGFRAHLELPEISRILAMSSRTLQRRLAEEGTSLQMVMKTSLQLFCTEKMKDRTLTLEQIAYESGFSAPSAFHRAFKRCIGLTPREFRARLFPN